MWIDFEGALKDYGGLNSGEELILDTYRTHPWMIATGPGDCLQIFLPAAEPAKVELLRLDADDAATRTENATSKQTEKKKTTARKAELRQELRIEERRMCPSPELRKKCLPQP